MRNCHNTHRWSPIDIARGALPCLLLLAVFAGTQSTADAQTNVRAWSAQGQVWVVWQDQDPLGHLYTVYWSDHVVPLTSCTDWIQAATLFGEDATVIRLGDQAPFTTAATRPVIPDGSGGMYQLTADEQVCALTPHGDREARYAVLRDGDCQVTPTRRSGLVDFTLDTVDEPVQPVLQKAGTYADPAIDGDIAYRIYCLWADGRDDYTDARADIPVLANRYRNATPHLFIAFAKPNTLVPDGRDVVHFLHGGGGRAAAYHPGNGPGVNLVPDSGLLVSHDDALFVRANSGNVDRRLTYWFGYSQAYNPFLRVSNNPVPDAADTIVNYTQARIVWINRWLVENEGVARQHCAVMGFSVGSHGASHLARAFPDEWSSVTLYNHNPKRPAENNGTDRLFGERTSSIPTNLTGPDGAPVTTETLWHLKDPISPSGDYPVMRLMHGTSDDNGLEGWDAELIDSMNEVNALGVGIHFYWDGRGHRCFRPDAYWTSAPYGPNDKVRRTDVSFQRRYSSRTSYPALYDTEMDFPDGRRLPFPSSDPADPGDEFGTWGGAAEWSTPIDRRHEWIVDAWLIDDDYSAKDRSPALRGWAKMVVRKARRFRPGPGATVGYAVSDVNTGIVLREGFLQSGDDGLVRLDRSFPLRRDRATRVRFFLPGISLAR